MGDEKGGKWAGEVYDFLKLFRRVNNSIFGLMLVELGWVLFLILLMQLTPEGTQGGKAIVLHGWGEYDPNYFLVPGGIVLAFLWMIWSNLWLYFWLPFQRLFEFIGVVIFGAVAALLALINLVLTPILIPVELFLVNRWIRKLTPEEQKYLTENFRQQVTLELKLWETVGDDARVFSSSKLSKRQVAQFKAAQGNQQKYEAAMLEALKFRFHEAAVEKVNFSAQFVLKFVQRQILPRMRRLYSQTYVGIAPLESANYEEGLSAAKAPAQVFATAMQRLHTNLQDNETVQHIHFIMLPEHVVPQNANEATWLRSILGLDVLLWGSYLTGGGSQIWLNVDQRFSVKHNPDDKKQETEPLFGPMPEMARSTFSIDQNDVWDMYLALVFVVIQIINSRSSKATRGKINWNSLDNLYFANPRIDEIIEALTWDVLRLIKLRPDETLDMFSPRRVLAELAGQWVAKQFDHDPDNLPVDDLVAKLLPISQLCADLAPDIPENHYRLGTLLALAGQVDESLEQFKQALPYETPRVFAQRYAYYADLDIELEVPGHSTPLISFARYLAYAARSVNISGASAKERLRNILSNGKWDTHWRLEINSNYKDLPVHRVLLKLISKEYNPSRIQPDKSH